MSRLLVSKRFLRLSSRWTATTKVPLLAEQDVGNLPATASNSLHETVPEDLAALMFTSGSTGVPKGVMISHRNIECNTRDIISYLGLAPDDRVMVVLPFHYCFGLSLLHSHLMAGASVVLNNTFRASTRPKLARS